MLANLVCSLIKHHRVTTTLAKAKAARPVAEKILTLGKRGTIHARRLAVARLHQEDAVRVLFNEIAPTQKERRGGYTRIVKLLPRQGDAADMAILEWVDLPAQTTAQAPAEAVAQAQPTAASSAPTEAKTETPAPSETKP